MIEKYKPLAIEIIKAILAEPGNPLHRYAFTDLMDEMSQDKSEKIKDLRNDNGMWLVYYGRKKYRLVWAGRVYLEVMRLRAYPGKLTPSTQLGTLSKGMLPVCDPSLDFCYKQGQDSEGRCTPYGRIAAKWTQWKWVCRRAARKLRPPTQWGGMLCP